MAPGQLPCRGVDLPPAHGLERMCQKYTALRWRPRYKELRMPLPPPLPVILGRAEIGGMADEMFGHAMSPQKSMCREAEGRRMLLWQRHVDGKIRDIRSANCITVTTSESHEAGQTRWVRASKRLRKIQNPFLRWSRKLQENS